MQRPYMNILKEKFKLVQNKEAGATSTPVLIIKYCHLRAKLNALV